MLSQHIKGVGAAPGLNIGQAIWWRKEKPVVETRSISDTDAEVEKLLQRCRCKRLSGGLQ